VPGTWQYEQLEEEEGAILSLRYSYFPYQYDSNNISSNINIVTHDCVVLTVFRGWLPPAETRK